jgi:hypothetical protein
MFCLQIKEKPVKLAKKPALKKQKPAWQVLSKDLRFFRTLLRGCDRRLKNFSMEFNPMCLRL